MGYSDATKRKLGCGCAALALVLVPVALINLAFPGPYTSTFPRPFDSERWKAVDSWDDEARCAMIADLEYRVGLTGRTRAEVENLLGPPGNEEPDQEPSHWHLCPSFMDIFILEIRYENGRVSDVRVRDT